MSYKSNMGLLKHGFLLRFTLMMKYFSKEFSLCMLVGEGGSHVIQTVYHSLPYYTKFCETCSGKCSKACQSPALYTFFYPHVLKHYIVGQFMWYLHVYEYCITIMQLMSNLCLEMLQKWGLIVKWTSSCECSERSRGVHTVGETGYWD